MPRKRKLRVDRSYIVYEILCIPTDESYIGISVLKKGHVKRTLKQRLQAHYYKATVHSYDWQLHDRLRGFGKECFDIYPVARVRGRAEAYKFEAELINDLNPELNTKRKK